MNKKALAMESLISHIISYVEARHGIGDAEHTRYRSNVDENYRSSGVFLVHNIAAEELGYIRESLKGYGLDLADFMETIEMRTQWTKQEGKPIRTYHCSGCQAEKHHSCDRPNLFARFLFGEM